MLCLTSSRFSMRATILRQASTSDTTDQTTEGYWDVQQDPDTGQMMPVWVPEMVEDDPNTPQVETSLEIPCLVRAIVDGGIRVAGTTERYGDIYTNVDFVRMWFPANVTLTKRDRVTNIKDATGTVIWMDEESDIDATKPTIFNVNGVSPLPDAFNRHVENVALLERVE